MWILIHTQEYHQLLATHFHVQYFLQQCLTSISFLLIWWKSESRSRFNPNTIIIFCVKRFHFNSVVLFRQLWRCMLIGMIESFSLCCSKEMLFCTQLSGVSSYFLFQYIIFVGCLLVLRLPLPIQFFEQGCCPSSASPLLVPSYALPLLHCHILPSPSLLGLGLVVMVNNSCCFCCCWQEVHAAASCSLICFYCFAFAVVYK